jgi:glutaredoxin
MAPRHRLRPVAWAAAWLLTGVAAGPIGCDAPSSIPPAATGGTSAASGAPAERPADSDVSSIGPEGETRIYYQFIDEQQRVRFVERLEDVPAAWREKVGFVELASPPPLTPADARRASRPDPAALAQRGGASRSVVLYYADWCGYCRQAKRHLNERGIAYDLRDVDVPAAKAELVARTGGKGIPVLDVDGRILRGYSRDSYEDFLGSTGL